MVDNNIIKYPEQQFDEVVSIILHHKSRASQAVNTENLLTAWHVGAYEEYSSPAFADTTVSYIPNTFIQPVAGQVGKASSNHSICQIVILNSTKSTEHRLFYILYCHKEHLGKRELMHCIANQTFESLIGNNKGSFSKGMLEAYPTAPYMFKDTLFVDFLNLPKKHSESRLKKGLLEFYLEAPDRDFCQFLIKDK